MNTEIIAFEPANFSPRLQKLFGLAENLYVNGDPGHDLEHIKRVMGTCYAIGKKENVDVEILLAGALLHDLVNLPKNHPERLQASEMAAYKSKGLLQQANYSAGEIDRVLTVVIEHSYSLAKKASSRESAILQDADKLDAIGAIGIMRAVSCGYALGSSYYNAEDLFAQNRTLDDKSYTIDHFFTKLLKLPGLMNTETAKAEARQRVEFMEKFLQQLAQEVSSMARPGDGEVKSSERIFSGAPWETKVGYCRALRRGKAIAVSGTVSIDDNGALYGEGDGYLQAKRALEIIEKAILPLGASRKDIIRTRMFVTDISRWEEFGRAHAEFFSQNPPATSMIEVKALIDPKMLIEIEADGVLE